MTTVCLNMIVRNEAHCIERCLKSVKDLIDCFLIVDTGSTDETIQTIYRVLRDKPGEVVSRPWRDFGSNRTEAITIARERCWSDYILIMDADDELQGPLDKENLTEDCYYLPVHLPGLLHWREQLFRMSKPFRYIGVIHEYLMCDEMFSADRLSSPNYVCLGGGDRSKDGSKLKYLRDAATLEEALKKDPNNDRYVFYLANTYRDAGHHALALQNYERRIKMTCPSPRSKPWPEHWYCLIQIALMREKLNWREEEIIHSYLAAWEYQPQRIETLYELGRYLQDKERHVLCYLLLREYVNAPFPDEQLFLDQDIYRWALADLVATSAYYAGDIDLAYRLHKELVKSPFVPDGEKPRLVEQLRGIVERFRRRP
jgi:glycosyltransferase involved in cell wall biosynthesis